MRRVALALVMAGCCATVAIPDHEAPRPPRVVLMADGSPVELVASSVETTIAHGIATTHLELTFQNDQGRVLEGVLVVPLPDGASLSSFALETDGKLREATLVDREVARATFESIERRKVDPALVEWSHGNEFRTRVYPIPAHGRKRVALGFEQEVTERFQLDLGVQLEGTLSVNGVTSAVKGAIDVALPPLEGPEAVRDASGVFFARIPVGEPTLRPLPRRVTVLFDAGSSALSRDLEGERALLSRALAGVAEIRLVAFAHQVVETGVFATSEELPARLKALPLDGGTRMSCLDLAALEKDTDAFLVLSDGVSSLGGEARPGAKPTTCIVSGAGADFRALARLGRVVDLRALGVEESVRRIRAEERVLEAVVGATETIPRCGERLDGSLVRITGRASPGEELLVRLREGASERTLRVPLAAGSGASRVHALRQIERLLAEPRPDVAAVVSLAKAEKIVTPYTSFVVLETLADYEHYGLEPPPELIQLKARATEDLTQVIQLFRDDKFDEAEKVLNELLARNPNDERARKYLALSQEGRRGAPQKNRGGMTSIGVYDETGVEARRREWLQEAAKMPVMPSVAEQLRTRGGDDVGFFRSRAGDYNQRAAFLNPVSERLREGPTSRGYYELSSGGPGLVNAGASSFDDDDSRVPDFPGPRIMIRRESHPHRSEAIATLSSASTADLDATYFTVRENTEAFYADAANLYLERGVKERALRVLTNLAALDPGDPVPLHVLAYRLEEANERDLALSVLERVRALRPEEPQSFRDLALAQAEVANVASATANLTEVASHPWDSRFPEIETIARHELLHLADPAKSACDLRVVVTWDANDCDVDLWVTEPSGEKVFYSHRRSQSGAQLSHDFTQGYGPEEYVLEHAPRGEYLVQANFFGDGRQTGRTDTTIHAAIFTHYGTPREERRLVVRRMTARAEVVDLARVTPSD